MKQKYLIFIVIGMLAILFLHLFDVPLQQAASDLIEPDYVHIPKLITNYGLYLFYLIFGGIAIYAFVRKERDLIAFCGAYIIAQLVFSLMVVRLLKFVLGRARPGWGAEFTFFATGYKYNAFPSGHAADAVVSGVFLFYLLNQSNFAGYRFLPLIYAILIAISRVLVSSHYPSDVAAGMAIGILGAWYLLSRTQSQAHQTARTRIQP